MTPFTRLLALFAFALFLPVAFAQTPVPIPITGNLGSITGAPEPDAYVQLQLQNCSGGVPQITGFQGIVQSSYRFPADVNGNVNGTVWPNDQITCSGTTGATQYAMTIVVDDSPVGQTQCYQVVHTQGNWNITTQPAISCTATPPNPQDGFFNNIFATLNLSASTGTFAGGVTAASFSSTGAVNGASGTITGAFTVHSLNTVVKVDQLSGATADVKLAACFTALGSTGGICDATGFGATSQTIAATITNTSGVPVQVIWDPATKLMPGSATVQMFHLNRGIQMHNAHIDIADSGFRTTYTGTVFLIDDNIREQDNFLLQNTYIDNVGAETQPAAGSIGLKMNATDPNLHSQVFAHIDNFTCRWLDKCIVMTATNSGFMNSNMFSGITLEGCTTCWSMSGAVSPASSIESTTVHGLAIQASAWTTTPISGSGDVAFTQILGCGIWDNPGTYDIVWDSATANNYTVCFNPKGINDQTSGVAGAEHNTYHSMRGSANQQASDVFNSVFSYDKLEGAYLYAIGKTSVAYASGSYIEWNLTNGNGEMDFVADRGGNVGGFNWYNVSTGDLSAGTPIMQLDGSGNLAPAGSVTAAGGSSIHGFTSAHLALPGAPTVTVTGTAGTTSYTYACTAVDLNSVETPLGTTTVIATGNATLSGSNYDAVKCPTGGGVTDNVYRTAGGATQGKIGSVTPGGTLNDTGLAASGSAPGSNLTGGGNFAGSLQWGGGATLGNSSSVPQYCGESTFSGGTSGSAVTCSWVTATSHCWLSWKGSPGGGILGSGTVGAGTLTPAATAASTGVASVACSVN